MLKASKFLFYEIQSFHRATIVVLVELMISRSDIPRTRLGAHERGLILYVIDRSSLEASRLFLIWLGACRIVRSPVAARHHR